MSGLRGITHTAILAWPEGEGNVTNGLILASEAFDAFLNLSCDLF